MDKSRLRIDDLEVAGSRCAEYGSRGEAVRRDCRNYYGVV